MGGKLNRKFKSFAFVLFGIAVCISAYLLPPVLYNNTAEIRLYSDTIITYEISGNVYYKESSQPVQAAYVKAVKFNWALDLLITVDSAVIEPGGHFVLSNCTIDSLFIMAYGDDELEDFVPGYHDTTIHWQSSIVLRPQTNISNANVYVNRLIEQHNGTHYIRGRVLKDPNTLNDPIENAIVYAKLGPKFKGYGITNRNGFYEIDSLPTGDFEIIAERIGYYKDYRYIQIGQSNSDTVNFYLERVASVNPPGKQLPKGFSLYSNYPNPFNPVTKIKFEIPLLRGLSEGRGAQVYLAVYNILGKEIDVLVNGQIRPGTYEVQWDGTNYPSGVYFYKLTTTDFTETRKMVLIK